MEYSSHTSYEGSEISYIRQPQEAVDSFSGLMHDTTLIPATSDATTHQPEGRVPGSDAYIGRLSPEPTLQHPDVSEIAVSVFDGLRQLHNGFVAEVVEGYPAAWNQLTQKLGGTLPATMRGYKDAEGRKIETGWRFMQEPERSDRDELYIISTIALPDSAEGDDIAKLLDELTHPTEGWRARLARPALGPIGGVKSYYNREQGKQVYPRLTLAMQLLTHVGAQTTRNRHRQLKQTIDVLLERIWYQPGPILLEECDFKATW